MFLATGTKPMRAGRRKPITPDRFYSKITPAAGTLNAIAVAPSSVDTATQVSHEDIATANGQGQVANFTQGRSTCASIVNDMGERIVCQRCCVKKIRLTKPCSNSMCTSCDCPIVGKPVDKLYLVALSSYFMPLRLKMWQAADSVFSVYPSKPIVLENCPRSIFLAIVNQIGVAATEAGEVGLDVSAWQEKFDLNKTVISYTFTTVPAVARASSLHKVDPDNPRLHAGYANIRIGSRGDVQALAPPMTLTWVDDRSHGCRQFKMVVKLGVVTIPNTEGAVPTFFSGYPLYVEGQMPEPAWRVLPPYASLEEHMRHHLSRIVQQAAEQQMKKPLHHLKVPPVIVEASRTWVENVTMEAKIERQTWHHPLTTTAVAGFLPDHVVAARQAVVDARATKRVEVELARKQKAKEKQGRVAASTKERRKNRPPPSQSCKKPRHMWKKPRHWF